jgi:FSR family fosmidomycin resistance protein-like MFS transporter
VKALRTRPEWGALGRVILVTMMRSWVALSVLQLSATWYSELGFGREIYTPLTSIIILSGVFGTLFGGMMADRFGQRRVIISAFLLTIPWLLLYAAFPGPQGLLLAALCGFCSDASLSITLVMAQGLMPGRGGVASGVILGLGFVTGGIGVPITGWLADRFGMQIALSSLAILLIAGALLALTLPSKREVGQEMAEIRQEEAILRGEAVAPRGAQR